MKASLKSCCLIYEKDLRTAKAGGIVTFIRSFIHNTNFEKYTYLGIKSQPPLELTFSSNKDIQYKDILLKTSQENKPRFPRSLSFVISSLTAKLSIDTEVALYNRIEHILVRGIHAKKKCLVMHSDIPRQIYDGTEVSWSNFSFLYSVFEKIFLRFFNIILCVNDNTISYLKRKHPKLADRIYKINTGYNEEIFIYKETSRDPSLNLPLNFFLSIGRLEKQKNLPLLLELLKFSP